MRPARAHIRCLSANLQHDKKVHRLRNRLSKKIACTKGRVQLATVTAATVLINDINGTGTVAVWHGTRTVGLQL